MTPRTHTLKKCPCYKAKRRLNEKIKSFMYKILVRLNYLCIAWTAFSFSASFTIGYIYFSH